MPRIDRNYYLFIIPFFICLLSLPARATMVVMVSDGELAVSSRVIVLGEVRSVTSAWDETRAFAWTYVEVYCERVLKGELQSQTIVLKQLGADFADSGLHVFGQPKFTPGQQALLYLNTAADGSLRVAHNFMGKFNVETDHLTGQSFVKRSLRESEVELFSLPGKDDITERAQLKDHLRNIKKTLRDQSDVVARYDAIHRATPLVETPFEYEHIQKQGGSISPQFELSGGGVRWMEADSGQPVNFLINSARSPVSTGGSTEVTRGMDAWSAQSGSSLRLQISGSSGSCGIQGDGTNVISFGDCLNQLDAPIGCSGVVALTSIRWTLDSRVVNGRTFNRLFEADIVFNDGMDCFLSNPTNLSEVACHELGHAIGLGHSSVIGAIMLPTALGGRGAVLGEDDKAGVLAIYPASSGGGGGGGGTGGSTNDAAFVTQNVPATMTSGQTYSASIRMRNTGSTTWSNGYKLISENPNGNLNWGLNSVNVPTSVPSGSEVTFNFTITAPSTPGTYHFQWRMMKDGTGGFGALTANQPINVSAGGSSGGEQVQITTFSLADATVGRSYKQSLSATGGRAPYQWQITSGSLPTGLTFSSSGVIEGIPTKSGSYSFGLQVYDVTSNPANSDAKRVTLNVFEPSGGGAPTFPVIARIKIKGTKKLFVIGQNFSNQSFIILNDVFLTPLSFELDGGTGTLFYKGRLTLREDGANTVKVINGSTTSTTFFF